MKVDKYLTRMHNEIEIHRGGDTTTLKCKDGNMLTLMKDIKKNINRGGADTKMYYLLDSEPLYTMRDTDSIFLETETIGYDNRNPEYIDKANHILRDSDKLHDYLMNIDEKFTICFNMKVDETGTHHLALVYGIDKESGKIVHPTNLPNKEDIPTYNLFLDKNNGMGAEDSLIGYHMIINSNMKLFENPAYKEIEWIREDPKNRKKILESYFTEFFYTECDGIIDRVSRLYFNQDFIDTMNRMKENYKRLLDNLVAVDMGIARLYSGNKPDNVILLETNNLFVKYGFMFMVNRRYIDIKYMKTLLIASIMKMETPI